MTPQIFNILFSTFILILGLRTIYFTYKEPSEFYNTNIRGYLSGTLFIIMSVMSMFGKFSLFKILSQMVRSSLKLKGENGAVGFALFVAIICTVFFFIYYRPNKVLRNYQIVKTNMDARIKLLSGCLLFYFGFSIVLCYLIVKSIK